jgi:hypothetical protein
MSAYYCDLRVATLSNDTFSNVQSGDVLFYTESNSQKIHLGTIGQSIPTISLNQSQVIVGPSLGIGLSNASYSLHLANDSAAKPGTNTWTISSDERLKTNIVLADLDTCYNIVHNLPLKRYQWRDDVYTDEQITDRNKIGWIAQDVESVFPKAVNKIQFGNISDCRTLNADQIYATLYGAVQKIQLQQEQLQSTVTELQSNVQRILTHLQI